MPHYLDALARAATLAQDGTGGAEDRGPVAPAVPRPRARFEPTWDEGEILEWPLVDEDGVWTPPADPMPRAEHPAPVPASAEPAHAKPDSELVQPAEAANDSTTTAPRPSTADAAVSVEAGATLPVGVPIGRAPAGKLPAPRETPPTPAAPVGAPPPAPSRAQLQPVDERREPAPADVAAAVRRGPAPAVENRATAAAAPPAVARAHPTPARAVEVAPVTHEHPIVESPQPVVIEIGRIEVRIAPDTQARPAREHAPQPRTGPSLADYLDGRPGASGRPA